MKHIKTHASVIATKTRSHEDIGETPRRDFLLFVVCVVLAARQRDTPETENRKPKTENRKPETVDRRPAAGIYLVGLSPERAPSCRSFP